MNGYHNQFEVIKLTGEVGPFSAFVGTSINLQKFNDFGLRRQRWIQDFWNRRGGRASAASNFKVQTYMGRIKSNFCGVSLVQSLRGHWHHTGGGGGGSNNCTKKFKYQSTESKMSLMRGGVAKGVLSCFSSPPLPFLLLSVSFSTIGSFPIFSFD